MKPHRHVGLEKIEKMTLIYGSFTLFYFNDNGQIIDQHNLEIGKKEYIEVPNKIWHTYDGIRESVNLRNNGGCMIQILGKN